MLGTASRARECGTAVDGPAGACAEAHTRAEELASGAEMIVGAKMAIAVEVGWCVGWADGADGVVMAGRGCDDAPRGRENNRWRQVWTM